MLLFNRLLLLLFLFLNKSSLQNQAHNFTWKLLDAGIPMEFDCMTPREEPVKKKICVGNFFLLS